MDELKSKFCIPTFLAIATTGGVFLFVAGLFFKDIPEGAKTLIDVQFGVIVAKWASIVDYHFGSSSGSAAKSKAIETMVADNQNSPTPEKLAHSVDNAAEKVVHAIEVNKENK